MIRSVLELRAADGKAGALEAFYAEHDFLARACRFPGCSSAVLMRPTTGSSTYLVIADWDSEEDYRRWVAEPWRAALSQPLAELLDTPPGQPLVGGLYEIVLSGDPSPSGSPTDADTKEQQ